MLLTSATSSTGICRIDDNAAEHAGEFASRGVQHLPTSSAVIKIGEPRARRVGVHKLEGDPCVLGQTQHRHPPAARSELRTSWLARFSLVADSYRSPLELRVVSFGLIVSSTKSIHGSD